MIEKVFRRIEISFENFIAFVTGSSYKSECEQQDIQITRMTIDKNRRKEKFEDAIETKNTDITQLQLKQDILRKELSKKNKKYSDLMDKYQDVILKNKDLTLEKRKLASSKGGLNKKIKYQNEKIKKYETENKEIKELLQKIIQESKRKLTPVTRKELENYNLFGNRGGKRR